MRKSSPVVGAVTTAAAILAIGYAGGALAATPLVSPQWVAEHACKPGVVLIDVRSPVGGGGDHYTYLRGHVKCAVYASYKTAGWRVKADGVPGMLPPVPKLEKLLDSLGVNNNDHVVIYSAGTNGLDMGSATRVFWTFKVLGHNNVSIMDGGYAAYAKAKLPVATGDYKPGAAGHFVAHFQPKYLATEKDVEQAMHQRGMVLVDNRPHAQYLGVVKPGMDARAGTVPGAKNLPQSWFTINDGGKFRSVAELKSLYKYAGVPTTGKQINFCNTGHWASLGWFVTSQLLGDKHAKMYDGSMAQWSHNSKLPMQHNVNLSSHS